MSRQIKKKKNSIGWRNRFEKLLMSFFEMIASILLVIMGLFLIFIFFVLFVVFWNLLTPESWHLLKQAKIHEFPKRVLGYFAISIMYTCMFYCFKILNFNSRKK